MSKQLKILVVDDNEDHADSLVELFELSGHQAFAAYSGEEAVQAYEAHGIDIAFMDVMMPGINGVESFMEIKKRTPNAKVFMMTGFSVEELLKKAIDHGALGVLGKPIDFGKVMAEVDKMRPGGVVLIAEDDPELGPALQQSLTEAGRRCELVTDGEEALSRVANAEVDVLILDLNLPLIDGIAVHAALRKANRAVPTIMMTACREKYAGALDALSDIEVTGILSKPFDFEMLLAKLDRLAA